jgi:hypothetical protein
VFPGARIARAVFEKDLLGQDAQATSEDAVDQMSLRVLRGFVVQQSGYSNRFTMIVSF